MLHDSPFLALRHASLSGWIARLAMLAGAVGCAGARPAPAALGPLVSDRPDFTEATVVIAPAHAQAEAGYTLAGAGATHAHSMGELLMRVGLAPRAELRLTGNYAVARSGGVSAGGMEDATVGTKLALLGAPRGLVPAVSLLAATSLPTGAAAFRSERATPEAKLALGWSLPAELSLGANANWSRPADALGRHDAHAWSASLGRAVTPRVGAYAELYSVVESRDGRASRFADGGVTLGVHDALQLDLRAGAELGGERGFFAGAGVVRRW